MQPELFADKPVILNITREAYLHQRRSKWLGGLLIATGTLAILFPLAMSLAAELLVGIVLTATALMEIIHAFQCRSWKGALVNGLTGLIALALGVLLLAYPLTGVVSLAVLLGVLFFASGVFRIAVALRLRPYDGWGWLLASGLLALVLALIVGLLLPHAAAWVLGVTLGVDLIFIGWWLLHIGMTASRIGRDEAG